MTPASDSSRTVIMRTWFCTWLRAETLLFYDNVHIVADAGRLFALANKIGTDNVISLLESHHIKVTCVIGVHCTFSQTENGIPVNRFVCIEIGGKTQKRLTPQEHL